VEWKWRESPKDILCIRQVNRNTDLCYPFHCIYSGIVTKQDETRGSSRNCLGLSLSPDHRAAPVHTDVKPLLGLSVGFGSVMREFTQIIGAIGFGGVGGYSPDPSAQTLSAQRPDPQRPDPQRPAKA